MKILYVTANSKCEEESSSKTVGRRLMTELRGRFPTAETEELDLYRDSVPKLKSCYFATRSKLIEDVSSSSLSDADKDDLNRITELCRSFAEADVCILAAPMWSLSFPSPVKEWLDCIVIDGKTVSFAESKPKGLLDDKRRVFIYVQSSGAEIPWLLRPALNKGLNYVRDIMKFLGISDFGELPVDGTGTTEEERLKAVAKATEEIGGLVDGFFGKKQ